MPLSTTHCQVGATVGVGILEGRAGVNRWVCGKTVFGWIITCIIVGLTSAVLVLCTFTWTIGNKCHNYFIVINPSKKVYSYIYILLIFKYYNDFFNYTAINRNRIW